jgi:hypothetical protein
MKRTLVILLIMSVFPLSQGQTPVGSWSDHLIYNTANSVAVGTKEVYASTGSSIIVYNKDFAELKKMSRINGLSETGISKIAWSEENNTLIIAYTSTNIDLVKNNIILNLPDISRKYIPGNKEIYRIRTNGKFAYLACSFGIVVLDIIKKEIYDTWKPGNDSENTDIWDITFGNGKIFAATSNGVYSADLSNPGLSFSGNWSLLNIMPNPNGKFTSLIFSGNKLYANRSDPYSNGDLVYAIDGESSLFSFIPGVYNVSFDPATSGFTISSSSSLRYYNYDGSLNKTISSYYSEAMSTPDISQSIADNSDIWIADIKSGLVRGENMSVFSALTLPGPASNNVIYLTSYNGITFICDGALTATWTNTGRPLQVSIHENNSWTSLTPAAITDGMRVIADPDNSNHLFISTWGMGLLEYMNNILVKQYTQANSPLQTIIPGQPYVRICGMVFDKNKNLWITQSEVNGSIKVLKPDGSWIVNPITIDAPRIGDMIIARNGYKWIILPVGYGLFILDDNNTPDVFTDDRYKKMMIKDTENKIVPIVYSIAEDLDGNIWVGTDQGPLVYYNPETVFDTDLKAFRLKTPRNDGTGLADLILSTETINSISVDGANRKWLGTQTSGVYLLSPDGTKQIRNYNELNSPILSNTIISLAVDNKSGEVWLGTLKGIQSVRGDATTGGEKFGKVYTFPNPVREDFTGNVTITGLMRNTEIRITDISGNLVYETVSEGGLATWNLKTYNGKHVATGVYLVFCSSSDGSKSVVTKMLVIR